MSTRHRLNRDYIDLSIGWYLKNWAACHSPPATGKARLLQAAAMVPKIGQGRKSWALSMASELLRAFVRLLMRPVEQPVTQVFQVRPGVFLFESTVLSQRMAGQAMMQAFPGEVGIFC